MDDLFPVPSSPLPPLAAARQRYLAACEAYDMADFNVDENGDPIPAAIVAEKKEAKRFLEYMEKCEMRNRKTMNRYANIFKN